MIPVFHVNLFFFQANTSLIDSESHRHWIHHSTVGRLSTLLALSLADATILQYNIILSSENLRQATKALIYDSDLHLSNTTSGMTRVMRKQTLRSLSFFFCYDTDFLEYESIDFIDHIL